MKYPRNKILFFTIFTLITAQVAWWGYVFLREVKIVEKLKKESLQSTQTPSSDLIKNIESESHRRQWMFLSESVFFLGLSSFGLWLIYQSLRFEKTARESQRTFIDMMTHESKTPITAIKLQLEALQDSVGTDFSGEIAITLDQIHRLNSMFEKALSLNRIERGGWHSEWVSLTELVNETIYQLRPWLRKKNALVKTVIPDHFSVFIDPFAFQTVLQNLIENAIIHNQAPNKWCEISANANGKELILHIQDNGCGFSEEETQHLFQRFYRGKRLWSAPGTGLGLHLAKHIIEAHDGDIRLGKTSSAGSQFEITLPLTLLKHT